MAYVHCMPALVTNLRHGLDNIVSGTLRTSRGDLSFVTRTHVVKATNKIYRSCPWKPSAGDRVLVDGDISGQSVVVDHIERDLGAAMDGGAESPHLNTLAALLPKHPPASGTMRVWRDEAPYRIRFAACASRRDRRGKVRDEIVHASYDDGRWSIWSVFKEGGELAASGIDAAIMTILARAAGADLLVGETERENSERIEREEVAAAREVRAAKRAPEPPPFDDCPF
jgi:hypothetical protein